MAESSQSRFWLAGWVLLGLVVLGGAVGTAYQLLSTGRLEEALRLDDRLVEAVSRATDGRYLLDLDGMTVAPTRGVVLVHNVRLRPAPGLALPDSAYRITFGAPEVRLEGVEDWSALLRGEPLTTGAVRIARPELRIDRVSGERSYRLTLERVDVDIGAGDLVGRFVRLLSGPGAAPDSVVEGRVAFTAPEFRLHGVEDWRRLTDERTLAADSLWVDRPHIHLFAGDAPPGDAQKPRSLHGTLARALADARLARVRIDEALISYTRLDEDRGSADTVRGVTLDLSAFDVAAGAGRPLFSEVAAIRLDRNEFVAEEGLYRLVVGPVRASSATRRLEVDTLSFTPTLTHTAMMRRLGHRKGQYDTSVRDIALSGFDLYAWLEEGALVAGRMDVEGFRFAYSDDVRWPPGPARGGPRLPHDRFREMERVVQIDTLHVRAGRVRYRRFAADGTRPGTLDFDQVHATFYNLTNNAERMSASSPAVAEAVARLAGSGRLRVAMRYNLLAPDFHLRYSGTLTDMHAPALNALFVPVQGIEIREGHVESLRFSVQVERGTARGTLESLYSDLHLRLVDKETGRQNLGRRLRSFVADRRVRSNNPDRPGREPRVGAVEHAFTPGESFFRFLWMGLRSGLTSITGIDRW